MIEPSDARQPVSDVLARELAVRFHAMAPPGFRAGKRPKPRVRSKLPVCLVSCRHVTDAAQIGSSESVLYFRRHAAVVPHQTPNNAGAGEEKDDRV